MALATGAIGVGSWAIGLSEVYERAYAAADAATHQQIVDGGNSIALTSLAVGAFLCALQIIVWGVARRRAQQGE